MAGNDADCAETARPWLGLIWPYPLIFAAVTLTFSPLFKAEFLNWDDDVYILANFNFRGLSWEHLNWMFTTTFPGITNRSSGFPMRSIIASGVWTLTVTTSPISFSML